MATFANINVPSLTPAGAPSNNAVTAGPDQFAADFGARYLVRVTNGHASATPDIWVQDPNVVAPAGRPFTNATAAVAVSAMPAAGAVRQFVVDASRFRNAQGNIVLEYSVDFSNAASLIEITRL